MLLVMFEDVNGVLSIEMNEKIIYFSVNLKQYHFRLSLSEGQIYF